VGIRAGDVYFCEILMPKKGDKLGISVKRYVPRLVNCIQIREQRDGDPVRSFDVVIPADNHASFTGAATPEQSGCLGANSRQINCGVTGSSKGAVVAIGLFKQQRSLSVCRFGNQSE